MRFALSEDQRLLQASAEKALAQLCPLERVRRYAEGGDADDVWRGLAELGLPGLMIDEAHGGLGLGMLEAAVAAEALGAAVAPTPFLGSGVLNGRSLFALDAAGADLLIVADRSGGLHLAGRAATEPMPTIDATRRLFEVRFERTPAEPLGGGLDRLRDAAWILTAADTLGAAQTMIDRAVAYAKERRQFGRTIGSFQAVKHLCAEMAAELEPARSLVWYAAYAFDHAPDEAPLMAAHAKAHTSEIGRFIARTATEVHGGIGMTDLLGLHYWFKRIGLNRQLFGSPERVRETAARLQGLVV